MEELVAELGAAFLCADLHIVGQPRADHANYLKEWLTVLRDDKRAIFSLARRRFSRWGAGVKILPSHNTQ